MTTSAEDEIPANCSTADKADAHEDLPLAIGHAEMNGAYDAGEATPLAASMSWLVRYQDAWWVVYERGWLRVTDTATAEDLDQAASRLASTESGSWACSDPRS